MGIEGVENLHPMPDPGLYPHKCRHRGCAVIVQFDDEPYCFEHSPDSGSDVAGYSARAEAEAEVDPLHKNVFDD